MKKNIKLFSIIFTIYISACIYISYEAQFISAYLESKGFLQEEYEYPLSGVIFCCTLYLLVILNYIPLFISKFSLRHPYLSFSFASIFPMLMMFYSFLGAMHASNFWYAFINVMITTVLVHFFALLFILKLYRY